MAKRPRSRPPYAMVEKAAGGRLRPVAAYDAAVLDQARPGAIFDLIPRAKERSNPQIKLYFGVLAAVVEATEIAPTAGHLHDQLVRFCGWVRPVLNVFTGKWEEERDSVAFDAMSPEEFNLYLDRALAKLSEVLGVDPLDLLPDREGRP